MVVVAAAAGWEKKMTKVVGFPVFILFFIVK